jgi:hypothetical protein
MATGRSNQKKAISHYKIGIKGRNRGNKKIGQK